MENKAYKFDTKIVARFASRRGGEACTVYISGSLGRLGQIEVAIDDDCIGGLKAGFLENPRVFSTSPVLKAMFKRPSRPNYRNISEDYNPEKRGVIFLDDAEVKELLLVISRSLNETKKDIEKYLTKVANCHAKYSK